MAAKVARCSQVVALRVASMVFMEKEDISMSRWPMKGKFPRIATVLFLVLSCMLLFQACSADCSSDPDITNVCLSVDPGIMCEDNVFLLSFHSWTGLQAPINGFWVFFPDDVIVPSDFSEECVNIRCECCTWTHPYNVGYYSETGPNWPVFAPDNSTKAVKIWINESIPHNQDVWIEFTCLDVQCPYDCEGIQFWVNNDIQRCPQPSNFVYMRVKVVASAGPNGTITLIDPPTGQTAPPDFETIFDCGETPTYRIVADECHVIDQIIITPRCPCPGCGKIIKPPDYATHYDYKFDPLDCSYNITATFKTNRVYAYLKYQLPQGECGYITKVKIWGADDIQPVLNFTDRLWQGGNTTSFNVTGTSSSTLFAQWLPGYASGSSNAPGDSLEIEVLTPPASGNPETFRITYRDTLDDLQYLTVIILEDGTYVWAPYTSPTDVKTVTNIEALTPAWQMVTQDYLYCDPDWEGLVGVVVQVDGGTYYETIEVDTPGVHLINKTGTYPVIDASGIDLPDNVPTGAVNLSAGCTGIDGFTIINSETNGILVWPSSWKCAQSTILHCDNNSVENVPCKLGRINVVNNTVYNNGENGVRVIDAVVLILDNTIYDNIDDGIDAGCLFCGVECIDPDDSCSPYNYEMEKARERRYKQ